MSLFQLKAFLEWCELKIFQSSKIVLLTTNYWINQSILFILRIFSSPKVVIYQCIHSSDLEVIARFYFETFALSNKFEVRFSCVQHFLYYLLDLLNAAFTIKEEFKTQKLRDKRRFHGPLGCMVKDLARFSYLHIYNLQSAHSHPLNTTVTGDKRRRHGPLGS